MKRTWKGEPAAWLEAHKDFSGEECLIWPFSQTRGYGTIMLSRKSTLGRKPRLVSRILCERHYGPPPTPKHQAAHSCGKGHLGCVNPRHISWKTRKENEADKLLHGTHSRGERHGQAKLTADIVLAIRAAHGIPQQMLADKYGVSQQLISNVIHRKIWTWLESST